MIEPKNRYREEGKKRIYKNIEKNDIIRGNLFYFPVKKY